MLHSAAWPEDADKDIKGKTVALIGNGSSGVQILPAILDDAEKIYVHIRSPTWITTNFASKFAGPGVSNYDYPEEQKAAWAKVQASDRAGTQQPFRSICRPLSGSKGCPRVWNP
ncbi:hypothetical protein LB505_010167 [Fusarium chuoi]|nr:hypothetical protein LB505_010167 [Fusarium chuoi]